VESPQLRQLLLETIAAARERKREFLALCDDSPPSEPGLWTVKDHLAHLTAWRINLAQLLDAGRTGTEAPRMDDDVQASNARVYAANKDKTAEAVKSNARAAYDRLEAAIAACSDEDLLKPHPRPRSAGVALWQAVPGHAHHLAEHLMFWHLEQLGVGKRAALPLKWKLHLSCPKTGFRIQLTLEEAFQKAWRGWMGIEPTQDASAAPRKRS
jgi:Protein of unknown function (DUF1706)